VSEGKDVSEAEDDDDEDFRTTIVGNMGDFSKLPRGVNKVVGNIIGQTNSGGQTRPNYRPRPQWGRPPPRGRPQRRRGIMPY